jgi:hypothetical protein
MTSFKTKGIGACLASILILSSPAGWASEEDDASHSKGLASILIEGASETATYSIDGRAVNIPYTQPATQPLVIKAGRHVIEVHEGEEVVMREEIVLKPGETRTLRVKRPVSE